MAIRPAGQHGLPAITNERQADVKRARGRQRAQPIRPFDQHDVRHQFMPPELLERAGSVQTPQVEVMKHRTAETVGLDQGEAGAGDFER